MRFPTLADMLAALDSCCIPYRQLHNANNYQSMCPVCWHVSEPVETGPKLIFFGMTGGRCTFLSHHCHRNDIVGRDMILHVLGLPQHSLPPQAMDELIMSYQYDMINNLRSFRR